MKRRWLLVPGFLAALLYGAAQRSEPMKTGRIGPWEFEIPDGWLPKEDAEHSYLESRDGTVGCYVKSIRSPTPKETAQVMADEIQSVHEASFRTATKGKWLVVDRAGTASGEFFRSRLDMLDEPSKYRILSVVLADASEALQVTIHNYWCDDYSTNRDAYEPVERSLRRASAGA